MEEEDKGFKITIDDGYCAWKYYFKPENVGKYCINDFLKVLCDYFKIPQMKGKLKKNYKKRIKHGTTI